jgi:Domain of unknown function (DUF1932)
MQEGVDEALLAEWSRSIPELPKCSTDAVMANARKAWRFVGEMEEIAATFGAVGLTEKFHQAAGKIYREMSGWKDSPAPPSISEIAKALTRPE